MRLGPHERQRFIPTPAGNTPGCCPAAPTPAVHPHACGEHIDGQAGLGALAVGLGDMVEPAGHFARRVAARALAAYALGWARVGGAL